MRFLKIQHFPGGLILALTGLQMRRRLEIHPRHFMSPFMITCSKR